MLSNTLLPNETLMAYHKGDRYCERISTAKTDMHNSRHIKQREYEQCHPYHNNTNICAKTQDPQCKFAVGSPLTTARANTLARVFLVITRQPL